MAQFCSNCGQMQSDDSLFCVSCGRPLKKQKTESDNELYGSESEWMTEENYEIEVNSSVVKVTAYPKGALITRQARVCLKKGRNLLRFTDLSDSIVPETLQIAMAEKISFSQVHYTPNKAKDSNENTVSAEPDELKNLRKEKVKLENRMSSVKSVSEKLKKQEFPLSENGFSAEGTGEYIDFVTKKTTELLDDISALEDEIQQIESQIADLEKNGNNQANASLTGTLNMATTAKADGDYKFELTYYDYKSEWTPHYDIYVKNLTSCAVFSLKGSIQQYTGEDWDNINLTFSTGNMQRSNNQPRLLPWFLNNRLRTEFPPVFPPVTARADKTTMLPNALHDMEVINEQPEINWKAEAENTYSANETSIEFRISGNVSVTSRRRSSDMIQILSAEHEASYFYSIIPKAESSAFLIADIKRRDDFPLLKADANIFLENRYVGATHINPEDITENLEISLGRDHSIAVQRQKVRQYQSRTLIRNINRKEFEYRLVIRNGKNSPIHAVIKDQIPVSTNDKIYVETSELSGARLNPEDGMLEWDKNLYAREELTLEIKFRISYPVGYRMEW